MLACLRPSSERDAGLIIGSLLVLAVIIAPPWSVTGLFEPANPCAIRRLGPRIVPARETPRPIFQPISAGGNPCAAPGPGSLQ